MPRVFFLLPPLVLAAACGPVRTTPWEVKPSPAPMDPAAEVDICEAVLRYLFTDNNAAEKSPRVVFLEIRKGDPPPELLARFSAERTPVKPVSAADVEPRRGVKDRATGESGLIFRIDEVVLEEDGGAAVKGGYYEGSLSASGALFKVVRSGGRWTVVQQAPLWIS